MVSFVLVRMSVVHLHEAITTVIQTVYSDSTQRDIEEARRLDVVSTLLSFRVASAVWALQILQRHGAFLLLRGTRVATIVWYAKSSESTCQ